MAQALLRHAELDERSDRGRPRHPFFRVDGTGVHEVAVGPVHAGIIEPGHFRFQCSGETVLHLEIQLGYQHRGAAGASRRRPCRRAGWCSPSRSPATRRSGTPLHIATPWRRWPELEAPPRAQAFRGDRARAGAGREPRRRSRRAVRRRRLSAGSLLSRPIAGRVPEPALGDLRQPVRPRPGRPGRRALRPG